MNWDERLALARERRAKVLERKAARAAERAGEGGAEDPGGPGVLPPFNPYEAPPDLINEDNPSEISSATRNQADISPLLRPFEPGKGTDPPDAANEPGPVPPITMRSARPGNARLDRRPPAAKTPDLEPPTQGRVDATEVQIETVLAPLRTPRRPFLRLATYAVLGLCVGLGIGFGLGAIAPWLYTALVPVPAVTVATETTRPAPAANQNGASATEAETAPAATLPATPPPTAQAPDTPLQTAALQNPPSASPGAQGNASEGLSSGAAPGIDLAAPAQVFSAAPERGADPAVDLRFVALSGDFTPAVAGPAAAIPLIGPLAADTVITAPAAPASTQTGSEIAVLLDAPSLSTPSLGGRAPNAPRAALLAREAGADRMTAAAPDATDSRDVAIRAPVSVGRIPAPQIGRAPAGLAPTPQSDAAPPLRLAAAVRASVPATPGKPTAPWREVALALPQGTQSAPAPQMVLEPALPAPETPPQTAQKPSATGFEDLRVVLNAPASVTDIAIAAATAGLGDLGAEPRSVARVNFNISRSQVRFFRAEDADAARQMAETLGARARDFTDLRPAPPAGTIEVFLAGRSARAAPAETRRQPSQVDLLRQRLIRRLQRGEIVR